MTTTTHLPKARPFHRATARLQFFQVLTIFGGYRSFRNLSKVRSFNPCGYAFVVEAEAFEFSSVDLVNMNNTTVPVVLDWSIGNVTCKVAQRNLSTYVCQALHSECFDASHGRGYRCNCVKGFQGNPYLPDGCQDID